MRERLWNEQVVAERYGGNPDEAAAAVLEQYKLYVEMADRVSARRGLANTYFLTLNSAVFGLVGVFWKDKPQVAIPPSTLAVLLLVALIQCSAWWLIVRSYRQLNSGKYQVVGLLEERLPASPYWSAEWYALGEGSRPRQYLPLSHVEQFVPIAFGAAYVLGFVLILT